MLINYICIDEEDTMGYSVCSSDGITYGGRGGGAVGYCLENVLSKRPDAKVGWIWTW